MPKGKSNVSESSAVTMETKLKKQVSKKYLVFFGDLLTLKLISSSLRPLK